MIPLPDRVHDNLLGRAVAAPTPGGGGSVAVQVGDVEAVVVDDSQFMRAAIGDVLESGGIEVLDRAKDGEAGLEAVEEHRPDVVTMDVEMPGMDGLEAVERIMDRRPTPVVMLSAYTDEGAEVTFEALERGAVDFFAKPDGNAATGIHGMADGLVRTVRSAAAADVSSTGGVAGGTTDRTAGRTRRYADNPVVVVGASTGGPPVVESLLSDLPLAADLRVLVVQHMVDGFTGRFADRLDAASAYDVREAGERDRITGGEVLVAPGGYHMTVAGYARGRLRVSLSTDPPENGVRPAIDVTMRSAARAVGRDATLAGVVLTGMGRDGAEGVCHLADAGATILAQDEDTSAVFGMPESAVETGHVDRTLPADRVADGLLDAVSTNGGLTDE